METGMEMEVGMEVEESGKLKEQERDASHNEHSFIEKRNM
jgi:hypothetical protein